MSFPIKSFQVFTTNPPNYSTIIPNSDGSTSNGLSPKKKLAIGIAIPVALFAFLCLLILYWYLCIYRRIRQHNPPREAEHEPSFQPPQPLPPETGIKSEPTGCSLNPTVFHPTPRLQHLSYPPALQINRPHAVSQTLTRKPRPETVVTSTTGAVSPRSSPPSRVPGMFRSSTQSAMRQSRRTHTKTTSRVSFDTSGRIPKKKKRTGWRDPASLEDLFD